MSPSQTLVSVEEYLSTTYRPDCDFVDGMVLERNMGEKPHARLEIFFSRFFAPYEDTLKIETLLEQRLQTQPTRFRIPDVMLVEVPDSDSLIVRTAPLLCIEILSSVDRMRSIQECVAEYAQMGCPASWVVDPWKRTAFSAGSDGILRPEVHRLIVPNTSISLEVEAIFAELDRLERRANAPQG
jgi:Uma2 family endonuclease